MNLNRYNPTSFIPHFTPDFLSQAQNAWYPPMYNPILHQLRRFPIQQADFAHPILNSQLSNPSVYDLQSYPTKRLRRTVNTYTEREFTPKQVSAGAPTINYSKNLIPSTQNVSAMSASANEIRSSFPSSTPYLEKEKKPVTISPKDEAPMTGSFDELEMPPLKDLYLEDLNVSSWLDAFRTPKNKKNVQTGAQKQNTQNQKQQAMSQIEKQKAQYSLQTEILRRLEKQHQDLANVIQQQTKRLGNSQVPVQKSPKDNASTTTTAQAAEVKMCEESHLTTHGSPKEKFSEEHCEVKKEQDDETLPCEKSQKQKKKRQGKATEDKPAQVQEKTKEAPRRRNQRQHKEEDADIVLKESTDVAHEAHKGRLPKPVEIPQHLVADNEAAFKRLISITLTNDPYYVDDDEGFVIFEKDSDDHKTRVGTRYQARVPCFNHKNYKAEKRKPKLAWKPGMMPEDDMKEYLADLCTLMECEDSMIHEEKALKLLARKDWEWEKLRTNICKNEKFYSKLLISSASTYSESKIEENL